LGVGASNLDDWSQFATRQLGLQQVDRSEVSRSFRMDDRKQRLMVDRALPPGATYFRLGGRRRGGAGCAGGAAGGGAGGGAARTAAVADQRLRAGRNRRSATRRATGWRRFYGPLLADEPFRPGRNISGYLAGALGIGHAVLMVEDFDAALAFYRDLLGFRVSDYINRPITACFLHVNPRHHSLALFKHAPGGLHHLMMEVYSLDDVGQSYDIAQAEGRVAVTLGRHPNDYMTSFLHALAGQFPGGERLGRAADRRRDMAAAGDDDGRQFLGARRVDPFGGRDGPPPGPAPAPPPQGRRARCR